MKKLEGKAVTEGQKVQFKSAGKKGKKEASDVVLVEGSEEPTKAEPAPEEAAAKSEEPAPEAPKEEPKKEPAAEKAEEAKESAQAAASEKEEKKEVKREDSKERTLRDDEECFIADYTGNKPEQKVKKFEAFNQVRRARIARDLVEEDPDVQLRVRKEPNIEADELMVIGADDTVEVVGRCGEWVRLSGDEERWMLSVKNEIDLIEVWSAGFFGGSWGFGFGGSGGEEKKEAKEEGEAKGAAGAGGGGWGFGNMSSYVPTGMLEGLSKNILAAGTSYEEGAEGKKSGASADAPPPAFPRPPTEEEKGAEKERKAAAAAAASPDLTDDITSRVDKTFNKEMELNEGGLAPVRYVSKGINMVEGVVGWLGSTAKEQAQGASKTFQEKAGSINTDELMEKAWSGVKGGVKASTHYGKMVQDTATHFANAEGVKTATGYGKTVLSTVGNTVINAAGQVLSGTDGRVHPNRELGGVLGIEISGVIIVRSPDVDEDEDPFCSDRFDAVPIVPGALEAVRLLVEQRFCDKVLLISVATPGVQAKMMRWLTNRNFYEKTGVSRDNVVFCRELDEKEDVCKEKNISVMLEASGTGAGIASKAGVETVLTFGDGADASEATQPLEEDGLPAATKWWKDVLDGLLPYSVAEPQAEEAEESEEGREAAAAKEEAAE